MSHFPPWLARIFVVVASGSMFARDRFMPSLQRRLVTLIRGVAGTQLQRPLSRRAPAARRKPRRRAAKARRALAIHRSGKFTCVGGSGRPVHAILETGLRPLRPASRRPASQSDKDNRGRKNGPEHRIDDHVASSTVAPCTRGREARARGESDVIRCRTAAARCRRPIGGMNQVSGFAGVEPLLFGRERQALTGRRPTFPSSASLPAPATVRALQRPRRAGDGRRVAAPTL